MTPSDREYLCRVRILALAECVRSSLESLIEYTLNGPAATPSVRAAAAAATRLGALPCSAAAPRRSPPGPSTSPGRSPAGPSTSPGRSPAGPSTSPGRSPAGPGAAPRVAAGGTISAPEPCATVVKSNDRTEKLNVLREAVQGYWF